MFWNDTYVHTVSYIYAYLLKHSLVLVHIYPSPSGIHLDWYRQEGIQIAIERQEECSQHDNKCRHDLPSSIPGVGCNFCHLTLKESDRLEESSWTSCFNLCGVSLSVCLGDVLSQDTYWVLLALHLPRSTPFICLSAPLCFDLSIKHNQSLPQGVVMELGANYSL